MAMFFRRKKVKNERTVGESLKSFRTERSYSIELVEEKTKISAKHLLALESDNYDILPAKVYVIGFLRRYADCLEINSDNLVKKFEEEYELHCKLYPIKKISKKDNLIKPNPGDKWLNNSSFVLTPKLLITGLIIFIVIGILSYIWYQVKSFASAPPLEIAGSTDEMVVKFQSITVEGQTDSGAILSINNQLVSVDPNGHFRQEIKLLNGVNDIEIAAKNKANKITKKILKVLAEY